MHGIKTLKELNEATAASQQKAAWPAPVSVEVQAESVDTQAGSEPPPAGGKVIAGVLAPPDNYALVK